MQNMQNSTSLLILCFMLPRLTSGPWRRRSGLPMAAMIDCDTGPQLCSLAMAVFDCRSVKHNWTSQPNSASLRETPSPPPLMLLGLSFQQNLAVWLRAMCHPRVDFHEFSHINNNDNSSFQSPTCSFSWMSLQHSRVTLRANHQPSLAPVLPGMRDFAMRRARLRDYVLLREFLAFCEHLTKARM